MSYCLLTDLQRPELKELTAIHFIDQNRRVTYEDLIDRSRSYLAHLRAIGVRKGDYVLTSFESEEDLAVGLLCLLSIGAVNVPVNPAITDAELEKIGKLIPIRFILTSYAFLLSHSRSLSILSGVDAVMTFSEGREELIPALFFLHHKLESNRRKEKLQSPPPGQVITCHFTYKGLGYPLGVEHTYSDYCAAVASCQEIFSFTPGRRLLTLLPCYPVFGLVTNLLFPLAKGCELVIKEKKFGGILKVIEDNRIDHINVVPVLLEKMLLEASKLPSAPDLSKLCIVAGGSYVTPELHDEFTKTFKISPNQGYGLTESLPILTNRPGRARAGTLGTLMRSDVELKICDARGFEVPLGKAGEICLKGSGIITRYLGEGDARDVFFRSGWLRTGDIGFIDEEGHVVFAGRRLNFTKILGNMVDLREIEDTARELFGVKNARSFVTLERGREKLSLSVFVARDFAFTRKDLSEHLRSRLSSFKIPTLIRIFKSSYDEVL